MPRRSTLTLSGRAVDALAVSARDVIVWDRELAGFGVRVYPSGRKVYVVQSRAGGGPRRVTLGTHGEITATQARKRAAQVIDRIKRGEEPGPLLPQAGTTVADLAERYMSAHVAQNCNAHTAGIYRGSLENHILPALGMMPLGLVERAHVSALHYRLRETPRAANRALAVLSKMFSLAAAWGLVPDGTNPCRAVRKYKERKRERFLSRDEYRRLGQALAEAEAEATAGREGAVSPYAIAALRLLMLTGCRLNEILTLRWDDVDRTAGEFRLRDGKTGTRMVPLTPTAEAVLAGIRGVPTNPWVIVGKQPGTHLPTITAEWYRLRARAGLDDVRIHDLRHSYASRALAAGESLSMIGKLLGPCRHPEHRPLRPPRARDREGVCRQGRRQHRRRHRAGGGRREGRRVVNYSASQPARGSITECVVDALPAGRDTVIWDRALTGFGVRVYPSGAKVYVVQTRGPAGTKRITVGRHGVIGADEARRRAALIIARIRAGEDLAEHPAQKPAGPTLAVLAERYLREHVAVRCKPSTAAQYRLAIERYIVPALGERAVSEIGRSHVADLQHALRDRPAMANLVIATLSRLIDQAVAWGVVQETTNPCRSAQKYRVRRRERFLTDAEFRRLGNALDELEATGRLSPHAASAHPPAHAHRLPAQRDPHAPLGGCAPGGPRAAPSRQQDRPPHDLALRRGGGRSGRHPQGAGQPLGDSRHQAGAAALQHLRALEPCARPRRPRRRAHPRPSSQLCEPRACAGREPAGNCEAPRPRPDPDNRPLHPPHQRLRQRRRNTRRKRHRSGYILDRCHPPGSPKDRRERGREHGRCMPRAAHRPSPCCAEQHQGIGRQGRGRDRGGHPPARAARKIRSADRYAHRQAGPGVMRTDSVA